MQLPEGVLSSFVDVRGIKTHYVEAGSGEPIVFVHGAGPGAYGWAGWRQTIPVLAKHFRVYALDTLRAAWAKVQANQGAAGVDGQSVERFAAKAEEYLSELVTALLAVRRDSRLRAVIPVRPTTPAAVADELSGDRLRKLTEEPHVAGTPADYKTAVFVASTCACPGAKPTTNPFRNTCAIFGADVCHEIPSRVPPGMLSRAASPT